MKRLSIISVVLTLAAVGFCEMNSVLKHERQYLETARANVSEQTQQLAQVQAEFEKETAKVRDLRDESARVSATTVTDPALIDLLLTTHPGWLPAKDERRLFAELGASDNSARDYVLVCKAALNDYGIHPFKNIPNVYQTMSELRGVLALTPEEAQSVEAAFAAWLEGLQQWAQANVQRTGPADQTLVSYTIPSAADFEDSAKKELLANLADTIGDQRATLLENYCRNNRVLEKSSLGTYPNKLTVWRVPGETSLFYTDGPTSPGGAELGIRNATPIFLKYFPPTFRYVFPGGWQEIAQREGFDLGIKEEK